MEDVTFVGAAVEDGDLVGKGVIDGVLVGAGVDLAEEAGNHTQFGSELA